MRKFIVKVDGKSYEVEVEELSGGGIVYDSVNNNANNLENQVTPKPQASENNSSTSSAPSAPARENTTEGATSVNAPMPGTILAIKVKEGETIEKGQILCVLEAMKMENEIVSPQDGRIAQINVAEGASVESDDTLFFIE